MVGCKFFGPLSPILPVTHSRPRQAYRLLPHRRRPTRQSKRRDTPREVSRRYLTRRSRVNGPPPPPVTLGASHRASPRVARRNREFEAGFPWWRVPLGRFSPRRASPRERTNAREPRRAEMSAHHATASTPRAAAAARGPRGAPARPRKSRRGGLGVASPETPCPSCRQDARPAGVPPPRASGETRARATTRPRRARARAWLGEWMKDNLGGDKDKKGSKGNKGKGKNGGVGGPDRVAEAFTDAERVATRKGKAPPKSSASTRRPAASKGRTAAAPPARPNARRRRLTSSPVGAATRLRPEARLVPALRRQIARRRGAHRGWIVRHRP